ncbi:hypothetical protein PC117_g15517 [Phytophthora cactorum]|uniref:Uncharacterized protein n=1 Tax=Phytophthora cactorum TaxID=29920 RepID=A0A8T1CN59_9STRA|nr:hypothetical protein PC117_g15517 [Phytophthora cactorum]
MDKMAVPLKAFVAGDRRQRSICARLIQRASRDARRERRSLSTQGGRRPMA